MSTVAIPEVPPTWAEERHRVGRAAAARIRRHLRVLPEGTLPSDRLAPEPSGGAVEISIVVPFYNPGTSLRPTVAELVDTLGATGRSFEVICVSDGATDGSDHSIKGLAPDVVRLVRLAQNSGKGQALRVGLAQAKGRYAGFIDADGDLPPSQLATFVAFADGDVEMIIGTKRHPVAEVELPALRRVYSWSWQRLTRLLFRLRLRDTQTGLKLFRRDVLEEVLPRTVETGFAFDVELLVVARRRGFTKAVEVPVVILERLRSTVSPRTGLVMARQLLAIFVRVHFQHAYDRPLSTAAAARLESPTPAVDAL